MAVIDPTLLPPPHVNFLKEKCTAISFSSSWIYSSLSVDGPLVKAFSAKLLDGASRR
jgi:hypothetical protein